MTWLLLVYTVPSHPSRKRAAVWREIKKVGAVYLRDGVAVLPERAETHAIFKAIATKVEDLGGQAVVAEGARLDPTRAETVVAKARTSRAEEYAEIAREAEGFLAHAEREREHRELTFAELEEIEEDLGKLRRWAGQVHARDYFDTPEADRVDELLGRCEHAVAAFLEEAYRQTEEPGS